MQTGEITTGDFSMRFALLSSARSQEGSNTFVIAPNQALLILNEWNVQQLQKQTNLFFFFPQKSLQSVEKTKSQYSCDENFQHSFFYLLSTHLSTARFFLFPPRYVCTCKPEGVSQNRTKQYLRVIWQRTLQTIRLCLLGISNMQVSLFTYILTPTFKSHWQKDLVNLSGT